METAEVRWFGVSSPPEAAVEWFLARGGVDRQDRIDSYQVLERTDLGVKRRDGTTLEIKVRRKRDQLPTLFSGVPAHIEEWCKWRAPSEDALPHPVNGWVEVHKSLLTLDYRPSGAMGAPLPLEEPTVGCEVELATVTIGGQLAWTLAFEARGALPWRRRWLVSTARLFMSSSPRTLQRALQMAAGYPEWLARATVAAHCGSTWGQA